MKILFKKNKGFSLIEILVVMAIVALLASGIAIWFLNYYRQAELDSSVKIITDILRDAQARSVSGKDFKSWGVYLDDVNNKIVLFRDDGGGYAAATVKEENQLSSYVLISDITLNGGGKEIIFNKVSGGTLQYGTANEDGIAVKIQDANNTGNFVNIIINSSGKIETNR